MSIFRDFFRKEKPVFTGLARGMGGFGFGSGGGGGAAAGPSAVSEETLVLNLEEMDILIMYLRHLVH